MYKIITINHLFFLDFYLALKSAILDFSILLGAI